MFILPTYFGTSNLSRGISLCISFRHTYLGTTIYIVLAYDVNFVNHTTQPQASPFNPKTLENMQYISAE